MTAKGKGRRASVNQCVCHGKVDRASFGPLYILTQKCEVGGGMADELDEGLPHGLPDGRVRRDDVGDREKREQKADADDFQPLQHHVLAPETWKTLVPNGRQQLLHVWVRNKLQPNVKHHIN